jgi:hypothetical protein
MVNSLILSTADELSGGVWADIEASFFWVPCLIVEQVACRKVILKLNFLQSSTFFVCGYMYPVCMDQRHVVLASRPGGLL